MTSKNHYQDNMKRRILRGEIYIADLEGYDAELVKGKQIRPVFIIQNNIGNDKSERVIVAKMTSKVKEKQYVFQLKTFLDKESIIKFEQLYTIPKNRLRNKIGQLNEEEMLQANSKLMLSLGLDFYEIQDVKIIKKIVTTNRKKGKEEYIVARIYDMYRKYEINVNIEQLKKLNINSRTHFQTIENKLKTIEGIHLLNKILVSKNINTYCNYK